MRKPKIFCSEIFIMGFWTPKLNKKLFPPKKQDFSYLLNKIRKINNIYVCQLALNLAFKIKSGKFFACFFFLHF